MSCIIICENSILENTANQGRKKQTGAATKFEPHQTNGDTENNSLLGAA